MMENRYLALPMFSESFPSWSATDSLEKLLIHVETQLKNGYDGHGHEGLKYAAASVRELLGKSLFIEAYPSRHIEPAPFQNPDGSPMTKADYLALDEQKESE